MRNKLLARGKNKGQKKRGVVKEGNAKWKRRVKTKGHFPNVEKEKKYGNTRAIKKVGITMPWGAKS